MLRVGHLEKSLDFYINQLGMNLIRKKDYPDGKFTLAFLGYGLESDSAMIELTYNWDKKNYSKGEGFGHIAIGVENIYEICKQLNDKGCRITRPPGPMKNSNTILAFIEDPDGYKIELIERK